MLPSFVELHHLGGRKPIQGEGIAGNVYEIELIALERLDGRKVSTSLGAKLRADPAPRIGDLRFARGLCDGERAFEVPIETKRGQGVSSAREQALVVKLSHVDLERN